MAHFVVFLIIAVLPLVSFSKSISNVELQWSVCEPSEQKLFQKMGVQPGPFERRLLYYAETIHKDLLSQNGVLRFRGVSGKMKLSAKVKFQNENQIPWEFLEGTDFKCELNSYMDEEDLSCSLNEPVSGASVSIGSRQKDFIRTQTGFDSFQELQVWGPAETLTWNWQDPRASAQMVVESTRAPRYFGIELSTRVPLSQKVETARRIQTLLHDRQIQLCPVQKGKADSLIQSLIDAETGRPLSQL